MKRRTIGPEKKKNTVTSRPIFAINLSIRIIKIIVTESRENTIIATNFELAAITLQRAPKNCITAAIAKGFCIITLIIAYIPTPYKIIIARMSNNVGMFDISSSVFGEYSSLINSSHPILHGIFYEKVF